MVPPGIDEYFVPDPAAGRSDVAPPSYSPVILGAARVAFADAKLGIDVARDVLYATPISDNAIPVDWGLGFAGSLALLGVMCSLASSRLRVVSAGVAGAAAVAAWALPLKLNVLVAIASAVAICLVLEKFRPEGPGQGAHHV